MKDNKYDPIARNKKNYEFNDGVFGKSSLTVQN
jgi:hypothetical protein